MPQTPWTEPVPLPSPPAWESWLFERPVAAAIVCLLAAALAFFILRRSGKDRAAGLAAGGLAALAACVGLLGALVTTGRERVTLSSLEIVDAFSAGDQERLRALLAEDLVVDAGGRGAGGVGRAFVLEAAASIRDRVTIDGRRVRAPAAQDGRNAARTQVFVRTAAGAPSITWWLFSWRKDADGEWRAHTIELLLLNGQKPTFGIENLR